MYSNQVVYHLIFVSCILCCSYEECKEEVVDVPYLTQEEQCEDVEYDECVDVEEQVPIQVCTVVDPNRVPIVNREIEGTKRRTEAKKTGVSSSRPSG